MPHRSSRRKLLQRLGLLVVGSTGAAVWWRRRLLQSDAERVIDLVWSPSRRLRRHFSYLTLDPKDIDQYVRDYERHVQTLSRVNSWPEDAYTRFLLSTDFFRNGADDSKPVRYIMIYQPYLTLCPNPFARFDDSPPNTRS